MAHKAVILALMTLLGFSVKVVADSNDASCDTFGGYQARARGRNKCVLFDPSWESSSIFELQYKHCLKTHTINLFIRNFQGIEEINHDFVPAEKNLRLKAFTGKSAKLMTKFREIKADKGKGIRHHLRVKVYFQPNTKAVRIHNVLTASFYMDLTDDCNWFDRLEFFERIFLGLGLTFLAIVAIAVACFLRRRKKQKNPYPQIVTHL